jgi:hypothetical protein
MLKHLMFSGNVPEETICHRMLGMLAVTLLGESTNL